MCLHVVCVNLGAQSCHKPWRTKSLRLAAAYISYGAADKILRRLTAYEIYGGLRRLMAAARGSKCALILFIQTLALYKSFTYLLTYLLLYAELAVSSLVVAVAITSTQYAYPRRDGQAELT